MAGCSGHVGGAHCLCPGILGNTLGNAAAVGTRTAEREEAGGDVSGGGGAGQGP